MIKNMKTRKRHRSTKVCNVNRIKETQSNQHQHSTKNVRVIWVIWARRHSG